MGSTTAKLMFITLISKFSGLLREMIFGLTYGTGLVKDVYVISESTASVLFGFLFLAIQSCFIPAYNRIRAERGRKQADRFTANVTNSMLVLTTVIIAFGILFTEPIIHIMASGYTGERFTWTVTFTRIELFSLYFVAVNACMISYLNIYDDFLTPATTGILLNIMIMLFSLIAAKLNMMILLSFGSVIATGLQYFFFPRALRRVGYRHSAHMNLRDPGIRHLLTLSVPIMFSIVVQDLSIIIDKTIASTVATEGGVSALDYGVKLYQLVYGIIIVSIVTAVFPKLSEFGQAKKIAQLKRLTVNSTVAGLSLVIPSSIGMMIFATPIVRLFFERGAFTAQSTAMTAGALFWYSPMLIALVFVTLATRTFYSIGDTRTPVRVTVIQVACNICLNLLLSRYFGINGLAAATSISMWISAFLILFALRKKLGAFRLKGVAISTAKILGVTVVMGISARGIYQLLLGIHWIIALLTAILFSAVLYSILILFVRIPEIRALINTLYHRFARKKHASCR